MGFKEEIIKHCKDQGITMHPGYDVLLDILADQLYKYWEAEELARERGIYNEFDNGTIQRNALATQMDKCIANIAKLADKFGLNPRALEAIKTREKQGGKLDRI